MFASGGIMKDDVPPLLSALVQLDEIFAVLDDDDAAKMRQVLDWAPTEGRDGGVSDQLREAVQSGEISDAEIEAKIAEMKLGAYSTRLQEIRCDSS